MANAVEGHEGATVDDGAHARASNADSLGAPATSTSDERRPEAALLDVRDLRTYLVAPRGVVRAVDGVSLAVARGETLGLVGESGCGKTVLSRSIMRLLPRDDVLTSGSVVFEGTDLTGLRRRELRSVFGARIAMVFQDPMLALHPVLRIGHQLTETLRLHLGMSRREARARAVELLSSVHIPHPESRLQQYPHELSGGMRQRVVIAIAIACSPRLLLADEATTALDVTVQAQVLDLLEEKQHEHDMAMILVSHDLGVVATRTDRIAVMYAGKIVETAPTQALFDTPAHPYTEALISCVPRLDRADAAELPVIAGQPPSLLQPPPGCRFAPRCTYVQERCVLEEPPLEPGPAGDHLVACWFPRGSPERRPVHAESVVQISTRPSRETEGG